MKNAVRRGREFLHTPGPTNMPDRILRSMDRPALDHRSPAFRTLANECFDGLRRIFKTTRPVLVYPSAGHGAWEASLVNTCSPGETVLMAETGAFSGMWKNMAEALGLTVEYLPGDWRHGADPEAIHERLASDQKHKIKAVAIVHNETSTGVTSRLKEIRSSIDRAAHPALFLVDTISSLASMDFRMDDWNVDVAVGGSQKGLMLPPGMGFTAISEKAWHASQCNTMQRRYWDWKLFMPDGKNPGFLSTPPINMFFGLREALLMLEEEGLENTFLRHERNATAVRTAIRHWAKSASLELLSLDPREHSNSISAVLFNETCDVANFRSVCRDRYSVVLAAGLDRLSDKVFRIGHLGDLNEPMILGTLAAVEMTLKAENIQHKTGGVEAAIASMV